MRITRYKLGLVLLLCFCALVYMVSTDHVMPWNRREAITTTLLWGGLAEVPADADNMEVRTYGSMFTRKFSVKFECSPATNRKWVQASKRLRNNRAEIRGEKIIYTVVPGEDGSLGGTVEITGKQVEITMSWS